MGEGQSLQDPEIGTEKGVLIFLVVVGGALGGVVRHLLIRYMERVSSKGFPWGTLVVNALGAFILGAFFGSANTLPGSASAFHEGKAFLAVGFCGGLTTFSTFSLQVLALLSAGKRGLASANIIGSVVVCLASAAGGFAMVRAVIG